MKTQLPPHKRWDIIEIQVADRMRRLRHDKGLTLRGLARASGISEAYLSRVENHKASVTIAGLQRLARALGVAISVFFEGTGTNPTINVCRAGHGHKGQLRGPRGFPYELMAAEKKGKLMEPLLLDVTSGSRQMPLKAHSGEEMDFVLEGEFELLYGKEKIRLKQGDAVYYDATIPHAARPVKGSSCRLLVVVASREYLFHGDLTRLLKG